MKKSLHNLLFVGLIASVDGIAQPTLTASGINPVIGDAITNYTSAFVAPGSAGANQTWNLSSMTQAGTSATSAVAPSSTPNGSSFPNSNVAFSGTGYYAYYNTSSTAWQNYGTSSSIIMAYSNPEDFLHFPFTYNNTYTDIWASTFISTYTYYRTGTTTVTADGYGTLTTPVGTFSNVLRVHFVQNYQDSTNIPCFGPYVITYQNDQYMWYLNGNHSPIASVYTLTTATSTNTGGYYMSAVLGINEQDNSLISYDVFPNPSTDFLNINIDLTEQQSVEIKLFNSLGSEVITPIIAEGLFGNNLYAVNVQNFPDGIYFAEVILNGIPASTRRFIVSK